MSELALVPPESSSDGPSTGLLSFYDRLRERVVTFVTRRGGRLAPHVAEALLLVPDLFMLIARLSLDRDVPAPTRSLLGGALLYFVVPVDLLPEAILGVGGFLDDLVLGAAVVSHALSDEIEPLAERHWSGSQELRVVLRDVSQSATALLGDGVRGRLAAMLRRYGIELERPPRP